jgi:NADPH:quinone reductase-like Zn-dependent oxidoreductase
MFQGIIPPEASTFQQYALVPFDFVIKLPSNLTFDEAASMPLGIATSFIGLYAPKSDKQGGGAGLTPFYEDHGKGKYAGKPIVVLGGATSMGQYGKHHQVIVTALGSRRTRQQSSLPDSLAFRRSLSLPQHTMPSCCILWEQRTSSRARYLFPRSPQKLPRSQASLSRLSSTPSALQKPS